MKYKIRGIVRYPNFKTEGANYIAEELTVFAIDKFSNFELGDVVDITSPHKNDLVINRVFKNEKLAKEYLSEHLKPMTLVYAKCKGQKKRRSKSKSHVHDWR